MQRGQHIRSQFRFYKEMFPVTSIPIFKILTWICLCFKSKSYKLILRVYKTGMKVRRIFFFFQETQQNCNLCCFDIRVPLPTCPRDNGHEQALIVQIKLKHRTGLGPVVSPHVMVISADLSTLQELFITLMCYKGKDMYRNKQKNGCLIIIFKSPNFSFKVNLGTSTLSSKAGESFLYPGAYSSMV